MELSYQHVVSQVTLIDAERLRALVGPGKLGLPLQRAAPLS